MLAITQSADAKIVYTPTHQVIGKDTFRNLDLNHDGIVDFAIQNLTRTFGNGVLINSIVVFGEGSNQVQVAPHGPLGTALASALKGGAHIAHGNYFYPKGEMVAQCIHGTTDGGPPCCGRAKHTSGYWINVDSRYLGLSFLIRGKTHYGWARLKVTTKGTGFTAVLTGYAYETILNKAIRAGQTKEDDPSNQDFGPSASLTNPVPDNRQPASLGVLAIGAPGLSVWRRKESAIEGN